MNEARMRSRTSASSGVEADEPGSASGWIARRTPAAQRDRRRGLGHLVAHAAGRAGRQLVVRERPAQPGGVDAAGRAAGREEAHDRARPHLGARRARGRRRRARRRRARAARSSPTRTTRRAGRWRGSGRAGRRRRRRPSRGSRRLAPRRRARARGRSRPCRPGAASTTVPVGDRALEGCRGHGVHVADDEVRVQARARARARGPESAATIQRRRGARPCKRASSGSPPANTSASIVAPTARGHADDGRLGEAPCAGMTRIRF